MSQAPSMPIFIDALLGDTLHLSAEEFGAYCLIMFATWRNNGQALADDDHTLARICRVTAPRWRLKLRPRLVKFFDIGDGRWHQKRLENEWLFVQKRAQISRDNGSRGGRAKYRNGNDLDNPAGNPDETQSHTREASTHTYTYNYLNKLTLENQTPRAREDPFPEPPWKQRCEAWAKGSRWLPLWGPAPDEPGCLAPAEVVIQVRREAAE